MKDVWESLPEWVIKDEGKKYIFGIGTDSMAIFLMTLNENVYVTKFIENESESMDAHIKVDVLFNKEIISLEEMEGESVLLCPDSLENIEEIEEQVKEKNGRICKIGVGKLSTELLSKDIVIYGAANRGKASLKLLQKNGARVIGFADSDKSKLGSKVEGLEVVDLDSLSQDTIIVIASGYHKEIAQKIGDKGFSVFTDYLSIYGPTYPGDYFYFMIKTAESLKSDILWAVGGHSSHFLSLLRDVIDKKIIVDGYNDYGRELVRILGLMDKAVEYYVDEAEAESEEGIPIKSRYDLIYEDMSDKSILVAELETEVGKPIVCYEEDFLDKLGLKLDVHYRLINTMSGEITYPNSMVKESYVNRASAHDPLLTYTSIYSETSRQYLQYIVHGNPDTAKKRLMLLGGSTTDGGIYYPSIKSWPAYLYDKLEGEDVVIFNGGIAGYHSRQECLKLLRDIEAVKPDLVISYSGINEVMNVNNRAGHPFIRPEYLRYLKIGEADIDEGMENEEEPAGLWLRMERSMKAICDVHGCEFIGLLQPAIYHKRYLTKEERLYYHYGCYNRRENQAERDKEAYERLIKARELPEFTESGFLYDLTDIFKETRETIFMDLCHVYEKGNQIIAEEVYKILPKEQGNKEETPCGYTCRPKGQGNKEEI